MGLGDILRRSAAKFPNKDALVFGERRLTYGELNRRVNRLTDSLLRTGLQKGDRVALLLHNCPEFIELYFACAKSGGILVPINNLLKEGELSYILDYIKPRFVFFDPEFFPFIQGIGSRAPFMEHPVVLNDRGPGFSVYEDFLGKGSADEPGVPISRDDIFSIFLTSGTTGRPKGAMRTHHHNLTNIMSCAIELGLTYDDRVLLLSPFYHVSFEDQIRHVLMSNTIVIKKEGSFDPREVLEILAAERITTAQFVPTMINAMLQAKDIETYDLGHFRLMPYAASPMPVELLKRAMQRFKCGFVQLYGQTETGPATTALRPEDHVLEGSEEQMARLASAGRPIVDCEVRIVDDEGDDVPVGEVGEIIVRTEAMTVGYWDLPEETAKTIRNGWLYTGDYGRRDAAGYVFIVDRKNDMIISGGKNIYPREVEEVIYGHEAVLEAAVVGIPDDYWGESVKALVVLKEGMHATEQEIIDLCKQKLASYKKPKSVEFRSDLPRNPTGKLLKRKIRDEFWQGRERRV